MRVRQFKSRVRNYLWNLSGWRTKRKIVVIESDDWGSIRMPSREVYEKCLKAGYPVDLIVYERYDSLASKDDLELLFELLTSFTDKNGNNPVITANCVVANPDFRKIKEDDFQKYHYELISETFKNYPNHTGNLDLWKEGAKRHIFHPQFHAREHLNVSKFMKALQQNNSEVHFGFINQMPGCIRKGHLNNGNYYVAATEYSSEQDKQNKLDIYLEGLDIFEEIFGFKSLSIIPPNYIWSNDFNEPIFNKGVKYIQGARRMYEPDSGSKPKYSKRFLGMKYPTNQIALVRNVSFEPTIQNNINIVENCLSEMDIAFRMKKPAIIPSHRINYVGFIDEKNRDNNLLFLKRLFSICLKKWPDIEFYTSPELGTIISEDIKI